MAVASKEEYIKMDEMYGGKTYLMSANTLMTWPGDIDGSRLYMNTSETKQSLTILNPDVPRLSNGWENVLGKLNKDRSYKKLEGTWEVRDIIQKFKTGEIYTIVLYNREKNLWDMIEKPVTESLNEKFGYFYNTERMDRLEVGEVITDEIIYKSTSYDEHMNYRYGKNAKIMFSTSTDTIEDAIKIRAGWANGVESVEVDEVNASVNNNHIPLNLYGRKKGEYQVCPNFGEEIVDSCVFALRPINYDHILIDLQNDALRKVNTTTDTDYVVSEAKSSCIYDIDIYYNGEEPFPDNIFFHQLKGYYDEICAYNAKITEWATYIKESGDHYTDNIPYYKSITQHFNDPEWPCSEKEKTKPFGYMKIVFKVKSILGLSPGSKLAGRFGRITPIYCRIQILRIAGSSHLR